MCAGREEARRARQTAEGAASELQRLEAGLQEVRGRLEQRRQDTSSQKSQGAVSQALMAAKASGEIPGIYGRLGESLVHRPQEQRPLDSKSPWRPPN